jgi:hypothetical protein
MFYTPCVAGDKVNLGFTTHHNQKKDQVKRSSKKEGIKTRKEDSREVRI